MLSRLGFLFLGFLLLFQLIIGARQVLAQNTDSKSGIQPAIRHVQRTINGGEGVLEQSQKVLQGVAENAREHLNEAQKTAQERLLKAKEATKERLQKIRDTQQEAKKKREEVQQEMQKKQEEFRAEAEKRKQELQKKLGEERGKNIDMFFSRMMEKFENTVGRLNDLANRIESRLNDAEANGRDVSSARTALVSARGKITSIQTNLDAARANYKTAVGASDFKASFANVKSVIEGVKEQTKQAHAALVDVVTMLKGMSSSTTTPEAGGGVGRIAVIFLLLWRI